MALRGGIDLGGTKIEAVVVDPEGAVVGQARGATPAEGGPPAVIKALASGLQEAAKAAGVDAAELSGVGVGSPGEVANGSVAHARNLPEWDGSFPLASALSEQVGVAVKVANDVGVAVDAEAKLGAGKGIRLLPRASGGARESEAPSSSAASAGSAAARPARSATPS